MANDVLISMLASLSLDSGVVTSIAEPGTVILNDDTKDWAVDKFRYCVARIIYGKGVGQQVRITSNGSNFLKVEPPWKEGLDASSVYVILQTEAGDQVAQIFNNIGTILAHISEQRIALLDYIKSLTRPQAGIQATTNVLAVVGAAIEGAVPFKVSGLLSLHNMQAGDTFLVIEEIRDQDDATYREYARTSYSDVQTSPIIWFEEKICQGWRIRIQRTAGGDRNVTYQYFKEGRSA